MILKPEILSKHFIAASLKMDDEMLYVCWAVVIDQTAIQNGFRSLEVTEKTCRKESNQCGAGSVPLLAL